MILKKSKNQPTRPLGLKSEKCPGLILSGAPESYFKSHGLMSSKYQKGISLYLGIIMLSLIFAIALIISNLFLIRLQISRDILNSTSAFYGADSALECAQLEITKQTVLDPSINCSSLSGFITTNCSQIPMDNITGTDPKPGIVAGGVACDAGSGTISSLRSAGSFKGTKRSTEVNF